MAKVKFRTADGKVVTFSTGKTSKKRKNPIKGKGKNLRGSVKHRDGGATVVFHDEQGRPKKVRFRREEATAATKRKKRSIGKKMYKANNLAEYQFTSSSAKRAAKKRGKKRKSGAKASSSSSVTIPKGKRAGDHFRKGNRTYVVVSYQTPAGKRVRYARKV